MTTLAEPDAGAAQPARPPVARRPAGGWTRRALIWTIRVLVVLVFFGAWQFYGTRSKYAELVFSAPSHVASAIWDWLSTGSWWSSDLAGTLEEAVLGYLLGVVAAIVLVALTAPSRAVQRFLSPFIAALNALPKVALAPLFILILGTTLQAKVVFVASIIAFLLYYGVMTALRTIDQTMIDNMRVLGSGRLALVYHVYGPATLGQVIASLRMSSAWALLGAVIAEYLAANVGLGYLIANGQTSFATDQVIGGIVIVAVIAVCLDRGLVLAERRLSRWKLGG